MLKSTKGIKTVSVQIKVLLALLMGFRIVARLLMPGAATPNLTNSKGINGIRPIP
jgi:hypothetical protein